MRRPSPYTARRGEMELKMTPMIDVIFLLLVFFVWTASFQVVENILPSSVSAMRGSMSTDPAEPPPPEEDFDNVIIRITAPGGRVAWKINDNALVDIKEVESRLSVIARIKPDAPVILHPDGVVPLGDVIEVYDRARRVGFEKVQFATSEEV